MMKQRVTTQEEILEHALKIAIEEGVDKVSIRKLATSCGIAVGSMYNYYKDKDALMTAVSEHFWGNILKDQEQLFDCLLIIEPVAGIGYLGRFQKADGIVMV